MNKTAVVFESKYGSTRQYAVWIAEALQAELYERKKVTPIDLTSYDCIVYGGGLYAGGVAGIDFLVKCMGAFPKKKFVLFTCGLADTQNETNIRHIRDNINKALTGAMQQTVQIFHLRGAIDYSKLSVLHKGMMAMMHHMVVKKNSHPAYEERAEFLQTYGKTVSFASQESIAPIIKYIQE